MSYKSGVLEGIRRVEENVQFLLNVIKHGELHTAFSEFLRGPNPYSLAALRRQLEAADLPDPDPPMVTLDIDTGEVTVLETHELVGFMPLDLVGEINRDDEAYEDSFQAGLGPYDREEADVTEDDSNHDPSAPPSAPEGSSDPPADATADGPASRRRRAAE